MKWDHEVDLAILGLGAAGCAAALKAHELGASVLIAEKQAQERHTPNFRMSGGLFMTMTDAEKGTQYLKACAAGMVPDAPLRALARRATGLLKWVQNACPDLKFTKVSQAEHPDFAGAESVEVYQPGVASFKQDPAAGSGRDLFASMAKSVANTQADVRWGFAARRLIRASDGRVIGVTLDRNGETLNVRATRGVVLATGGFEFDEAAKLSYLRAYPMHFYGNPGNTGDGMRMAQEVGADLWHMGQIVGRAIGSFPAGEAASQAFFISINPPGYVITDRFGRRFANEHAQALLNHSFYYDLLQFDAQRGLYPRIPCYWFFDERRRKSGPLTLRHIGACGVGLYDWSEDNSREIEQGWIARGDSIEEAAKNAGIEDVETAVATINEYNESCRGTVDKLGRPAATMVSLDEPPYYCVPLWPGGSNTTGGPRRDDRARVLDAFQQPIRGLFAAGELGQVSGLLYPADGANLCEAFCYGQIAAESALRPAAGA